MKTAQKKKKKKKKENPHIETDNTSQLGNTPSEINNLPEWLWCEMLLENERRTPKLK